MFRRSKKSIYGKWIWCFGLRLLNWNDIFGVVWVENLNFMLILFIEKICFLGLKGDLYEVVV